MQKTAKTPRDAFDDPELDISSLIDVSFLLLIFFLVTSTLLKRESDLGLQIPSAYGESVDPLVALDVSIAADGRVTIGGQEFAGVSQAAEPSKIDEVREQLVEYKLRSDLVGDAALVRLSAAGETNAQRFIDVVNALTFAGIDHIAMTDPELAAH